MAARAATSIGPEPRQATTCSAERRGWRGSMTENRPSRSAPRTKESVTREKKTAARAFLPRYQCPAPGMSQARTHASISLLGATRSPLRTRSTDATSRFPNLLLFRDLEVEAGRDVLVQLDQDRVRSDVLDRLLEGDPALVDLDPPPREKI